MENKVEQCPKCGNYVEGKIMYSANESMTRAITSKGTSSILGGLIGGLIGSFAFPIGTIIGFAIGTFITSIISKGAAEVVGNELFKDSDYLFSCPKCGHKWTRHLLKEIDSTTLEALQKEKDDIINFLEESYYTHLKKMVRYAIYISLGVWYCYTHDFETPVRKKVWLMGEVDTFEYDYLWYIIVPICIYYTISFLKQIRSIILEKKERLELEEMSLEEFRGNSLRYKTFTNEY